MQNKGAWLESLLNETEKSKKKKVELDPYEVEFMYRPPETEKETDPEKQKEEVKEIIGAPLGLDPMKCFKCGKYGHAAVSRSCPLYTINVKNEEFLKRTEDPMHDVSVKYLVSS